MSKDVKLYRRLLSEQFKKAHVITRGDMNNNENQTIEFSFTKDYQLIGLMQPSKTPSEPTLPPLGKLKTSYISLPNDYREEYPVDWLDEDGYLKEAYKDSPIYIKYSGGFDYDKNTRVVKWDNNRTQPRFPVESFNSMPSEPLPVMDRLYRSGAFIRSDAAFILQNFVDNYFQAPRLGASLPLSSLVTFRQDPPTGEAEFGRPSLLFLNKELAYPELDEYFGETVHCVSVPYKLVIYKQEHHWGDEIAVDAYDVLKPWALKENAKVDKVHYELPVVTDTSITFTATTLARLSFDVDKATYLHFPQLNPSVLMPPETPR